MSNLKQVTKMFNDINFLKKLVSVLVLAVVFLQFFSVKIELKSAKSNSVSPVTSGVVKKLPTSTNSNTATFNVPQKSQKQTPSKSRNIAPAGGGGCGV